MVGYLSLMIEGIYAMQHSELASSQVMIHPLLRALESRDEDWVKNCLRQDKRLLDIGLNTKGKTILHCAAASGLITLVEFLLEAGVDVDARDHNQRTPLHDAAQCGREDVVRILLDRGATIDARDATGETPLTVAQIAHEHEGKMVQLLLEQGALYDRFTPHGKTLLHRAAQRARADVMRLLIELGADINALDSDKKAALYYCVNRGYEDAVYVLLKNGADIAALGNDANLVMDSLLPKLAHGVERPDLEPVLYWLTSFGFIVEGTLFQQYLMKIGGHPLLEAIINNEYIIEADCEQMDLPYDLNMFGSDDISAWREGFSMAAARGLRSLIMNMLPLFMAPGFINTLLEAITRAVARNYPEIVQLLLEYLQKHPDFEKCKETVNVYLNSALRMAVMNRSAQNITMLLQTNAPTEAARRWLNYNLQNPSLNRELQREYIHFYRLINLHEMARDRAILLAQVPRDVVNLIGNFLYEPPLAPQRVDGAATAAVEFALPAADARLANLF